MSKPAIAQLQPSIWNGETSYSIIMNLYWGTNGSNWSLFEDGKEVFRSDLVSQSPNKQTASFPFTNKANGPYTYYCILRNAAGETTSPSITVMVTQNVTAGAKRVPAAPQMSTSVYDGSSSYNIKATIFWGDNATSCKLFENEVLTSLSVMPDKTPATQICSNQFQSKAAGVYVYRAEFSNSYGTTSSLPFTYTVKGLVVPPITPVLPVTPTGLTVIPTETTNTLTWTPVLNTTSDIQVDGTTITNQQTPFVHSGLNSSQTYNYQIRATNVAGSSAWSVTVTGTTLPAKPIVSIPDFPKVVTTVNSSTQITVTFSAANAQTYDVLINGLPSTQKTSPFIHSGLTPSTTYSYSVRATNSLGSSAYSLAVTATTLSSGIVPAVPTGLTAVNNSAYQVQVNWLGAAGAVSYELQKNGSVQTARPPFLDSCIPATSYTYAVRSVSSTSLRSEWSPAISTITPAAPVNPPLSLGQMVDPNCRFHLGYYPSWSATAFSTMNADGSKKTDDQIYSSSDFAQLPGIYSHVVISFAKPDFTWAGLAANTWAGTGIELQPLPKDFKEAIRIVQRLGKKVILAVGGATYSNWSFLAAESVNPGPISKALTQIINDLNLDGLDVDEEIQGISATNLNTYTGAILTMRAAVDASTSPSKMLTVAGWSTGADYLASMSALPGFPGMPSYWSGSAGRERLVFTSSITSGKYAGKKIADLFDLVQVMSYDAQTNFYDPVVAWAQYRALIPAQIPVLLGTEPAIEGWAGGVLVIDEKQSAAPGTVVLKDQYSRVVNRGYCVERFLNAVLSDKTNPKDGSFIWHVLLKTSVQAGAFMSANATTIEQKVSSVFGYVPKPPA